MFRLYHINFFKIEVLLALYLLSGIIKGFLSFYSIHTFIDLTFLIAIFLIIIFILELEQQRRISKLFKTHATVLFFLLFWLWMLISLIYTKSNNYSITKTIFFGTNLVPIYFILAKTDNFNIRLFLRYFIFVQLVLVVLYLPSAYQYYKTWNPKLKDFTMIYLSLAENVGLVFLSLCLSRKYIFSVFWDYFLMIVSLLLLFALSARGPLFFVLLIVFLNYITHSFKVSLSINKRIFLVYVISFIAIIFVSVFYWDSLFVILKNTFFRINIFFESFFNPKNMQDSSISLRIELLDKAFRTIFSNYNSFLFGKGIGSFGIEIFGIDSSIHPHNNIVEILFELGLIGLVLYGFFLISIFYKTKFDYRYISYLVILYAILNILKSSSLIEIRTMLSFIILNTINANKNDSFQPNSLNQEY